MNDLQFVSVSLSFSRRRVITLLQENINYIKSILIIREELV